MMMGSLLFERVRVYDYEVLYGIWDSGGARGGNL